MFFPSKKRAKEVVPVKIVSGFHSLKLQIDAATKSKLNFVQQLNDLEYSFSCFHSLKVAMMTTKNHESKLHIYIYI